MTVIVVHTTESPAGTADSAADWMIDQRTISNEVFDPSNRELVPLVPWPYSARSLRNLPGGVETNGRGGVYQIEVVGKATQVPFYPDAWHKALAEHLVSTANRIGCPIEFPCTFMPYPASYGASRVRMTPTAWLKVEGIVGHQHVPENAHGDPGDIGKTIAHIHRILGDDEMALAKYMQLTLAMSRIEDIYLKHRGKLPSIEERRSWETDFESRVADGRPIDAACDWLDAALYTEGLG